MKFELHPGNFRRGVLFLSGRGKSLDNFNQTSTGKRIGLEENLRKRAQTCLVEFDQKDEAIYLSFKENGTLHEPPLTLLIEALDPKVKWVVVASSMGAYFASFLPEHLILGYVLIDPVHCPPFHPRLPIQLHLALTPDRKINYEGYDRLTSYHSKSAIIVHWNRSHLIHWDEPAKITVSITLLLK